MADTTLTALPVLTSPADDDLVYVVSDPAGTPASKKATVAALRGPGAGTPGGADTEIQVNVSGSFGADSQFTFDPSTHRFRLGPPESDLNPAIQDYSGGAHLITVTEPVFSTGVGIEAQGGVYAFFSANYLPSDAVDNASIAVQGDGVTGKAGSNVIGVRGWAQANGAINAGTLVGLAVEGFGLYGGATADAIIGVNIPDVSTYSGVTTKQAINYADKFIVDGDGIVQPVGYKSADGSVGASGSFTSQDGKTITVKDGLITAIV